MRPARTGPGRCDKIAGCRRRSADAHERARAPRGTSMRNTIAAVLTVVGCTALLAGVPRPASAAEAALHHIHITTPSPSEAVGWYKQFLGCTAVPDRNDAAQCG